MKKRQHKTDIIASQSVTNDTYSAYRLKYRPLHYVYRLKRRERDWDRYYATLDTRYIRMNCEE
jgi:hypothetical protein